MSTNLVRKTLSGVDIAGPGGLEALFSWHRNRFGDLRMDGTATPPADPAPAPPADPPPDPAPEPEKPKADEDGRAKALAEERRRAKAAEAKAAALEAKVQAFENEKLSEQERAAKELADAKAAAEAARAEAARFALDAVRHRIAAEKSVPAALLVGANEEELTASADEALKWREAAAPAAPKAPKPDQTVGARGETPMDGADLYRQKHPARTPAAAG